MVMDPVATPAPPKPATNRPPMNMADEVAAPQRTEPISNIKKKIKNVHYYNQSETGNMGSADSIRTLVLKCL